MIFNIFCDASIDTDRRIACGGCYIIYQPQEFDKENECKEVGYRLNIQHEATNNSSEILAIWTGVVEVIKLKQMYPNAIFRLFSDSKISLYGLRDWMKNWIKNSEARGSDILISSSGQAVANQQYFIDIFNLIIENNIRIELYHQRGHVGEGSGVNLNTARSQFIRANKVTPENLGLDMSFLSACNRFIDHATRDAVKAYIGRGVLLDNTNLMQLDPLYHIVRKNRLDTYIRNINKTSVTSRHDFKGGYNQ